MVARLGAQPERGQRGQKHREQTLLERGRPARDDKPPREPARGDDKAEHKAEHKARAAVAEVGRRRAEAPAEGGRILRVSFDAQARRRRERRARGVTGR